jgi:hypothetical protein
MLKFINEYCKCKTLSTLVSQRAFCDTENSFTKINFIASFLVIIECGVGIDSKFQC